MSKSDSLRPNTLERPDYNPTAPQEEFIVPLLRQNIERILSEYAQPKSSNPRVLDVGCGRQPFRRDLEALGYSYLGLDVQQNPEDSVDIICEIDKPLSSSITRLDSFNFILCTEVMEHVADWDIAFKNFAQLLAPGGRLFITCPHFYQLHEEPYDFWRPTPYALQYFGNKNGLKVLYQAKAGDAWDVLGTLLANFHPSPVSRSFRDKLLSRMILKGRNYLFQIIKNRSFQKHVKLDGLLYLSNIMVFEKQ